jgi:hypothetical protein
MNLKTFLQICLFLGLSVAARGQVIFTDNFNPPSPLWNNASGGWTATNSDYFAQHPNNNPFAATWLPFDLTDFTLTVHVNNLADGGILLRGSGQAGGSSTGPPNTVICILGGNNYGQGGRGGNAGTASYWHVDGSGAVNEVDNVFTPGSGYDLKITVISNTYSIYINGSTNPANTLVTSQNPHGFIGLYDDQPNTTTGSGSGPAMSFSSFSLTGTLYQPTLSIALAGNSQVTLSWPTNFATWTLQSTFSLPTTNWAAVTNAPAVSGTNLAVTVSAKNSAQFFRLKKN